MKRNAFCLFMLVLPAVCVPPSLFGGGKLKTNPPGCDPTQEDCGCSCNQVSADCIKVNIGLGDTTPWTGSLGCSLKIFADDDSPSIFTPESLHAVLGGYTFKRLGQKTMTDGVTPAEVVLSHSNGEAVHFVFANGESLGRPDPGVHIKMDARLQMVDSEGWATTHDPVYYDLYVGDGTKRRFLATNMTGALGALVSITDERGVVRTPADMGVDIIYDPDGVRQYLTPSRLANVTRTAEFLGYDVAVYALQEPPQKDAATGMYPVPAGQTVEHVSVRRENGGKRAVVTIRKGGGEPLRYVFDYAMNEWSLTRPSGMQERKECIIADGRAAQITKTDVSSSGEVLAKKVKNYKWMSWGFAMTNRVEGFDGVTDTTTWTYYTSGNGKGQVKTEKRQSGLLTQYAYDNLDRVASKTRSGPDMMTEVTSYDYTPVDASDPVLPVDTRPRTVVRKLNNIECERTYYVYSPLTNIVERVGNQGAAYGGTNALRTVTTFYPVSVGASLRVARSGFVASIRHEDGKLDLYDYELSSNIWVRTVTHLHEQSPSPVSGKTTRDITATNRRGETLEQKTEAFIDGVWYTIARNQMTYNSEGKRITSENLAGQVTTTAWNCCHKVSETKPDGSTTTWDYDVDGRMIATSRLIPLDMTNVTWLTTCYEYDDLGRQVAMWQTNYAAQVGLPATKTRYDQLGRVISRVDKLGNTTTTEYSPDGRTVSVHNPNTSTRVTTRSASGDTLSITGSAVTPEFYSYGILPDGTRWSRTVQGETASSPRFTKRYENLLVQTIREERSGFQGAVLAKTHTCDSFGRLITTEPDYEPAVEYIYDATGVRSASVRHADGQWRKTETTSSFTLLDNAIWLTKTNVISCSDSAIAPLVSSSARQLTGLTAVLPARSRSTDIRGNAMEDEAQIESSTVTFRQTLPYATNKPLRFSRYGVSMMDVSVSAITNTVAFDALGRRIANTDGRGDTTYTEYNALGQRSASIDPLGNRTTYAYDQFGNLASVTDPLNHATVYEYDLRGRKTYEGGATYPVRYVYDVFGNKTTMTTYRDESLGPNSGDVTTWLYDEASNCMTNKVYADGAKISVCANADGSIFEVTRENGVSVRMAYNGWGIVTNTAYGSSDDSAVVLYDQMGRLVQRFGAGSYLYLSDRYGNVTNEMVYGLSGMYSIGHVFDTFGRLKSRTINGKKLIDVEYEEKTGRIGSLTCGDPVVSVDINYLPGTDLESELHYSNGMRTCYSYAPGSGNPISISNSCGIVFRYLYDPAGKCIECNDVRYDYNTRGELIRAKNAGNSYCYAFAYDDAGNRVSAVQDGTSYQYLVNNLNQCTNVICDGVAFPVFYDICGNATNLSTRTGRWSITYNNRGMPVQWRRADGTSCLCLYDDLGRRVFVRHDVGFETQRLYLTAYQDYSVIARDVYGKSLADKDSGLFDRYYYWGPERIDMRKLLLIQDMAKTNQCFCLSDKNKNLVGEVYADMISLRGYAPFGMPRDVQFTDGDILIGASSEEFDTVLGITHYHFRYFNPMSGTWLSRDPLGEQTSPNLYRYLKNDPINRRDILGLMDEEECNKQISDALRSDEIGSISNVLQTLKCPIPPATCVCCEEKEMGRGSYNTKENAIKICSNRHEGGEGYFSVKSTLFHEYIHALQMCKGDTSNTCDSRLCKEIMAHYQQASWFMDGYLSQPKEQQQLILSYAIMDSCDEGCASEYEDKEERSKHMEEYIKNNFDRCKRVHSDKNAL